MSKFGELIEGEIPVLLEFYSSEKQGDDSMKQVLRTVAEAVEEKARVIKINVDKNRQLSGALHIKELPTWMIYKNGDMKWRQSGNLDADTLIGLLKEYF